MGRLALMCAPMLGDSSQLHLPSRAPFLYLSTGLPVPDSKSIELFTNPAFPDGSPDMA